MKEKLTKYRKEEIDQYIASVWGFFTGNIRVTIVVLIGIIIWGVRSYISLPQENTPEIKVPIGVIYTNYPGATAIDVEELITNKIEDKISSIDNLNIITSSSREGVSSITVEFNADADLDDSYRELRDAVDNAKPELPEDANDPIVKEIDFSNQSIVTFSLVGNYTYRELVEMAKEIQEELESYNNIREVKIIGEREEQFKIYIDKNKIDSFDISLDDIQKSINMYSINLPVGSILVDDLHYQVRFQGKVKNEDDIKNIPIKNVDNTTIFIKDISDVKKDLTKESQISRLSLDGERSKNTISLSVYKKAGANIIQTVDKSKAILDKMQGNKIPSKKDGLDIVVTNDRSDFIREDFGSLSSSALLTVCLIFIILLIALGFKEAIIAGFSIPLSFLITFGFLDISGNTLNNITIFSLVLGLGLLVDTSIVIMEGIHDGIKVKKLSPIEACFYTIKTYKRALISGTLTTVSAFVPMLLMSGIVGQFFSYIPITISIVLISSLVVSLTISPALARFLIKDTVNKTKFLRVLDIIQNIKHRFLCLLERKYIKILKYFISTRKRRWFCVLIAFIGFVSAMLLPITGLLSVSSFPLADTNFFYINIEAPEGTKLEKTDTIVEQIEKELVKDRRIVNFVSSVGNGLSKTGGLSSSSGSGSNQGSITVNLIKKGDRKKVLGENFKSYDVAKEYKELFSDITTAKISIPEIKGGPPSGAPIEIRIYGNDFHVLEKIAKDFEDILASYGTDEISNSIEFGTGDFVIHPKIELMSLYNLTPAYVASSIRNSVYGKKIGDILENGEEKEIWVKYGWGDQEKPQTISEIKNIQIVNGLGERIPLKEVADISFEPSFMNINHRDSERIVTVSAEPGKNDTDKLIKNINKEIDDYKRPEGYRISLGGETEDVTQSFNDLENAMILAVLLIAFILILQFHSFTQPFIIILSLPMSLIGVFWGLFIMNINLDIAAFIGIVALSGIVVNDAIVLIDRINYNRRDGMDINTAVLEAGPARLQPILITSITTVFGILPLSLTDEFWLGLGSAIMFGITFSTLLTLLLMPVIYIMFAKYFDRRNT